MPVFAGLDQFESGEELAVAVGEEAVVPPRRARSGCGTHDLIRSAIIVGVALAVGEVGGARRRARGILGVSALMRNLCRSS